MTDKLIFGIIFILVVIVFYVTLDERRPPKEPPRCVCVKGRGE